MVIPNICCAHTRWNQRNLYIKNNNKWLYHKYYIWFEFGQSSLQQCLGAPLWCLQRGCYLYISPCKFHCDHFQSSICVAFWIAAQNCDPLIWISVWGRAWSWRKEVGRLWVAIVLVCTQWHASSNPEKSVKMKILCFYLFITCNHW